LSEHWWHGYQAEVPDLSKSDDGSLGPALAFTIIGDTPKPREEMPPTYDGTVFGHELTFAYVTTWDHEPSDEEKEAVQPEQYRLSKEKEEI
jgi:hypothetical protein